MSTVVFNGLGQANTWNDMRNWGGHALPGSTDLVQLVNVGAEAFTGPISFDTIMLLGASNLTFDGVVNASGEGFCRGIMVCNGGSMTFGAGSTLNALSGSLNIGVHAAGAFTAKGLPGRSTTIKTADALVGQFAQGIGTVTIDGATWNASGTAIIGGAGTGSLDVRDAGQVNIGGNLCTAGTGSSVGSVTIESGSTVSVAGSMSLGNADTDPVPGLATLTVNAGGTLNVGHWMFEGPKSSVLLNGGAINLGTSGQGWIGMQAGGSISGYGTLSSRSNLLWDDGVIKAQGGTLEITSNVAGAGRIVIGANSVAKLDGTAIQDFGDRFRGCKRLAGIPDRRQRDITDQWVRCGRQDRLRHDHRRREMASHNRLSGAQQRRSCDRHACTWAVCR